jgi:arylsulfatase A-like enzyme
VDLDLDLGRFAGPATLRLAAETPGTPRAPEKTFALWSRPVLHAVAPGGARPNLLFVTIDALRADHVGAYGYARPTTPALDRLAAEGIRFARAFTNAPMTVPSLPQIFTSRHFPTAASPTLVSSLFAAGFPHTKAIVHNPYLEYFLQLDARDGFDSVSGVTWRADRIAAKGLEWIDARRGERWALYLHVLDVHTPYRVRPPAGTRFSDPAYRGPVGYGWGDVDGAQQGRYDDADRAEVVARYDAALRFVDDHLGALFDALRARGLLDRTLVVVSSDHGEELWDHGGFFHGVSLYDEQLHVPLIVRLPNGARAGTVVERTVRAIDIAPTIADALGAPLFPEFEGESLLPLVADAAGGADREVFARAANTTYPLRMAVRTPTHKLVQTLEPFAEELFDLVADPEERRNLAADPGAADALAAMRARLARHRAPLAAGGFQVRAVAATGHAADVEVTITSNDNQMLTNPDRVGGDRPGALVLARDGLSLAWRSRVDARVSGFRFDRAMRLHDDGGLTIRVRADGRDLPPDAIVVGPPDAHPDASPFVYRIAGPRGTKATEQPRLVVDAPPVPTSGGLPLRVYVWRRPEAAPAGTPAAPTDEKTRERLRALGYAE